MKDIVSSIINGDKNSFKELFEDYYPVLCSFSLKFIDDEEQCKDIAQEALLLYWERRADFDALYKVKSFLYTVTRNRCLNVLRRNKVDAKYINEVSYESDIFMDNNIIEQEAYLLVRKAVESLPPQMRAVIEYSIEGLKRSQIALEMGIAEGTVHSLKKTAYRKLQQQLQDHFYMILFF